MARSVDRARRTTENPLVRIRSRRSSMRVLAVDHLAEVAHRGCPPHGEPRERERVRRAGRHGIAHGVAVVVADLAGHPPDLGVGVAERIGQSRDLQPQVVLEHALADVKLFTDQLLRQLVELRVLAAMRANLDSGLLDLGELAPVEHALLLAFCPDPVGRHEKRAGEAVLLKQRQRLAVKVPVPVVKSQHNRPLWEVPRAVGKNRGERSRGDRAEARIAQVGELISEDVR